MAIVPLRKVPMPGGVGADHFRLWELVAKGFLAAHLPDAIAGARGVPRLLCWPSVFLGRGWVAFPPDGALDACFHRRRFSSYRGGSARSRSSATSSHRKAPS